jgi:hypothetical protein
MKTLTRDGADARFSAEAHAQRQAAGMLGYGIYAETMQRCVCPTGTLAATGTVGVTSLGLAKGDPVSGIALDITTAGATLSLFKVGLYDKLGNRLAVSADASAAVVSTGVKLLPILTPYIIPEDDLYFIAALSIGTTSPSTWRSTAAGAGGPINGAVAGRFALQSGQTDLQATHAYTFNNGSSAAFYAGVY